MTDMMHRNIMIYGKTREQAIEHMKEITKNVTIVSMWDDKYIDINGCRYVAKKLMENCRGHKYSKLYISRDLLLNEKDIEMFYYIALPSLVYWNPEMPDKSYNWKEHIYIY